MRISLLALGLLACSVARADVIPEDYQPPPPPRCTPGSSPRTSVRGHGGFGGCQASVCESDATCGPLAPCREAALCVMQPMIDEPAPPMPDGSPRTYRIASSACDTAGMCPTGYECERAMRCVGEPPPPPGRPAPSQSRESAGEPSSSGWGGCSTSGTSPRAAAPSFLVLAAILAARRRLKPPSRPS